MPLANHNMILPILLTTFTTIFLAELGDKTQIAVLLLTAQSGQPFIVFVSAGLALILSSLVGVLLGRWISTKMPPEKFEFLAGSLMLVLGVLLALEAAKEMLLVS